MTENALRSLSFFGLFCSIIFTFGSIFSFDLKIKFRKTKQKVITLVATTLKALFPVAKTNGAFSGCMLYAGNIDCPFRNILTHISPICI